MFRVLHADKHRWLRSGNREIVLHLRAALGHLYGTADLRYCNCIGKGLVRSWPPAHAARSLRDSPVTSSRSGRSSGWPAPPLVEVLHIMAEKKDNIH